MIFYLGNKVEDLVPVKTMAAKNNMKSWRYGYNKDIDTVIISKDGTLGEIYNIQGLNIGLPLKPDDKDILNYGKNPSNQKWKRQELPEKLSDKYIAKATMGMTEVEIQEYISELYSENYEYINEEYRRRYEGVWVFINGIPIYLTGTYYYGIQWFKETTKYPNFRVIQNELMIFWEACKADERSYGMQYVKNRRMGASLLALFEIIESGTITEDKVLGMISKKGDDAKKIFRRLVTGFKRLPSFFKPITDGTNTPKKELIFEEPTKRRKKGEKLTSGEGLSTYISWHNTDMNAMDGDAIFRALVDEAGKFPPDVPFTTYWSIVKTSLTEGAEIRGKAMVVSTVNSLKKGGLQYKKVYENSNLNKRDENGQTKSGLYPIFIAAKYCLEGFFDEFGFTLIDDPEKPTKTDSGKIRTIGAATWLKNKADALRGDPDEFNEFMRQFPNVIEDAFRDASDDCEFNLPKLLEQMEHNEDELNNTWTNEDTFIGNDDLERGNFTWKDGIQDTEVIWRPDPERGRFYIKKNCHPPMEYRNRWEEKMANGVFAKAPLAAHIGCFGVDPYNRSKNADGQGSKGCIIMTTSEHTCDELPRNTMVVEYIDRPKRVELFFEDVIMASVYYSIPFLAEQSNDRFLAYVKDRGYRHFSLNNPFKLYKDLNPAEKEFGGAPPQDTKIGDQQFYATETYVEDYIGVARDNRKRPIGTIGDMPFTRTLIQLKDVNTSKRTEYDAYIGFSLSLLGNQKRVRKAEDKPKKPINLFPKYDNSGLVSKAI